MPPVNPLSIWRRRFAGVVVAGVTLSGAVAEWAMRTPPRAEWKDPSLPRSESRPTPVSSEATIDRAVFEKNLWMPLSKPGSADLSAVAIPKPKELPLEVDLIGISDVNGALVAALYDRRAD